MQADLIHVARARAAKLRDGEHVTELGHAIAAAVLEACADALQTAQAKVAALPLIRHVGDCTVHVTRLGWKCDCGADAANLAHKEARQALGLPE